MRAEGVYDVDANTSIYLPSEDLNIKMPEEHQYETVSGFLCEGYGYIPRACESIIVVLKRDNQDDDDDKHDEDGSNHRDGEDATDDDTPSTSGRQFADSHVSKRFGQSPLPAYEPAFDWENERSMIFGQRTPETPVVHHGRVYDILSAGMGGLTGLKISVKVLSLTFQAGIVS
ncbi:hypothetical protein SLEP1_g52077 [Rubroshorea leprosula]|uniref:Transporter-associated domain-containing protein n=1 Tax=Rubroshorea leprosula TaxID=152421 RepID=A0AAV5M5C6_9ROSI|nr:hypothetical protein SLEP1_g52077 [Rubroshorea leprosula]